MEKNIVRNVQIHYDIQLEPEVFDLLLKSNMVHTFGFSSEHYIPFNENETIFLQIGDEWFDARISKIKKGIEFSPTGKSNATKSKRSQVTVLIDTVLLDRDRLQEYVGTKKRDR